MSKGAVVVSRRWRSGGASAVEAHHPALEVERARLRQPPLLLAMGAHLH